MTMLRMIALVGLLSTVAGNVGWAEELTGSGTWQSVKA